MRACAAGEGAHTAVKGASSRRGCTRQSRAHTATTSCESSAQALLSSARLASSCGAQAATRQERRAAKVEGIAFGSAQEDWVAQAGHAGHAGQRLGTCSCVGTPAHTPRFLTASWRLMPHPCKITWVTSEGQCRRSQARTAAQPPEALPASYDEQTQVSPPTHTHTWHIHTLCPWRGTQRQAGYRHMAPNAAVAGPFESSRRRSL